MDDETNAQIDQIIDDASDDSIASAPTNTEKSTWRQIAVPLGIILLIVLLFASCYCFKKWHRNKKKQNDPVSLERFLSQQ